MALTYFNKYFDVLGIPYNASDQEIKKAYRTLAKRYHPDRSGTTDTRMRFIEINQSYEILMNRREYISEALKRAKSKKAQSGSPSDPLRNKSQTRARAETYADMNFKAFEKTPIYKTAQVVNSASNYVFLFMGFLMVAAPIVGYYTEKDIPTHDGRPYEFQYLPIFIGIAFIYGIWYFLFKNKDE